MGSAGRVEEMGRIEVNKELRHLGKVGYKM